MRCDPDTCRDPDLLAREVQRLQALLDETRSAADQADAEYRAEIEQLKLAIRRLADQDATLSVAEGKVIVEMDATLTDAEREAIQWAAEAARDRASVWTTGDQIGLGCGMTVAEHGDTLRGLLERTNTTQDSAAMSPASTGPKPSAYLAMASGYDCGVFISRHDADDWLSGKNTNWKDITPLYVWDDWDELRKSSDRVSREEGSKVMEMELHALHAENARLRRRLAAAESREAGPESR